MAMEVPFDGVVDANTGEYLSGKAGNVGNEPVFAHVVNDEWVAAVEDDDTSAGDFRFVVKESKSASRSTSTKES